MIFIPVGKARPQMPDPEAQGTPPRIISRIQTMLSSQSPSQCQLLSVTHRLSVKNLSCVFAYQRWHAT